MTFMGIILHRIIGAISMFVFIITTFAAPVTPEKEIKLQGIMEVNRGGESMVLVAISENGMTVSDWLKSGSSWGQYRIVEASAKDNYAIISKSGVSFKVILKNQAVNDLNRSDDLLREQMTSIDALDWKWITSDENPMMKRALDLPPEIVLKWSILSNSEKDKIRAYYRQCGFNLEVDVKPDKIYVNYARIRNPNMPIDRSKFIPAPKLLQLK